MPANSHTPTSDFDLWNRLSGILCSVVGNSHVPMLVVCMSGTPLSAKSVRNSEMYFLELRCLMSLVWNRDVVKSDSGVLPNRKLGCREIPNWGVSKSEVGVLANHIEDRASEPSWEYIFTVRRHIPLVFFQSFGR